MTEAIETTRAAIAEYSPTAAALAELSTRYRGAVFDVTTSKGDKEARAARLELVRLRTALEAKRKELKAPALERSRLIDAEAKRIEAEILALETPIDEQIKAEETRRERERQEKAETERRRVLLIQTWLDEIKTFPVRAAGKGSVVIEALADDLVAIEVGDKFAEFRDAAERARAQAITTLREMYAAAQAQEAEARRLREEREEIDRQRREDEARRAEADRAARERHEAEVLAMKEQRERQEAELRAQREAEEALLAEQRRVEAERQAQEQRRIDAERAEVERQQAEVVRQRREQDAREAAALAAAERAQREREEARLRAELATARATEERMARLSGAAEQMLRALTMVRLSAAWPKLEPGTQKAVELAVELAERGDHATEPATDKEAA